MTELHNLIFCGETLPGHEPRQVRAALSALLKLSASQCDHLFSGAAVVVKRDLAPEAVGRYVAHLEGLGARISVSPPLPGPALTLEALNAPEEIPPVLAPPLPPAEEMSCPKCGERQPKRTLCRACSTDMPRFLAAQKEAAAEALAARRAASADNRPVLRSQDAGSANPADAPAWIGASLSGRFGRLAYLWSGCLVTGLMALGIALALKVESIAVGAFALILGLLLSLRIIALRCHDVGWSGWFALGAGVPYLGTLLSLVLLVLPGQKGRNAHGPQPSSPGAAGTVLGIAAAVVTIWVGSSVATQVMRMAAERQQEQEGMLVMAQLASGSAKLAADNHVTFYSPANCPCVEVRQMLKQAGVETAFYVIERDLSESQIDALWSRLAKAGIPTNPTRLPVVDVNGKLLTDPKPEEIFGLLHLEP